MMKYNVYLLAILMLFAAAGCGGEEEKKPPIPTFDTTAVSDSTLFSDPLADENETTESAEISDEPAREEQTPPPRREKKPVPESDTIDKNFKGAYTGDQVQVTSGGYTIVMGSFKLVNHAESDVEKLAEAGVDATVIRMDTRVGQRYRVCAGQFSEQVQAVRKQRELMKTTGRSDIWILDLSGD